MNTVTIILLSEPHHLSFKASALCNYRKDLLDQPTSVRGFWSHLLLRIKKIEGWNWMNGQRMEKSTNNCSKQTKKGARGRDRKCPGPKAGWWSPSLSTSDSCDEALVWWWRVTTSHHRPQISRCAMGQTQRSTARWPRTTDYWCNALTVLMEPRTRCGSRCCSFSKEYRCRCLHQSDVQWETAD